MSLEVAEDERTSKGRGIKREGRRGDPAAPSTVSTGESSLVSAATEWFDETTGAEVTATLDDAAPPVSDDWYNEKPFDDWFDESA